MCFVNEVSFGKHLGDLRVEVFARKINQVIRELELPFPLHHPLWGGKRLQRLSSKANDLSCRTEPLT